MRRPLNTLTAVSVLMLASVLVAPTAMPAPAEGGTCQGRPVTVTGNTGTEGDDVMVVVFGTGDATTGAGADLVCLRDGHEVEPYYTFDLDTGPGDDVVHNEALELGLGVTTVLGAGADHYTGSDTIADTVIAGPSKWVEVAHQVDPEGLGAVSDVEGDTIRTGGYSDTIYSGSTIVGSLNPDVLDTGAGDDLLVWAGEQDGPTVNLGSGGNAVTLYPGWRGAASIHAGSGTAVLDGRRVLHWTGKVRFWRLLLDTMSTTFTGTDLGEHLTILDRFGHVEGPGPFRSIDMRGDNDLVEGWTPASGRLNGGAGTDFIIAACPNADFRMDVSYRCHELGEPSGDGSGELLGWERVDVRGITVDITGTNDADMMIASGREVRMNGRGGDDVMSFRQHPLDRPGAGTSVLRGWTGADEIYGESGHDRILGGPGRDLLHGSGGKDTILGGGGRDDLHGDGQTDLLNGGTGHDRAWGGTGRDRCRAEVEVSCER